MGHFKAILAAQHKLLSSLVIAFLTLALSFAGAVDTPLTQNAAAPAAAAGQVCETGWTLQTAAGTYKNYCYNNIAGAAETLTVPAGINTLVITAYGGGGGGGGGSYDGCCGNDAGGGAAGAGGKLTGNLSVTAGQVIGFYPGGQGGWGVTNSGLNTNGGVSTYDTAYNGGKGGWGSGARGGSGGAGGAATILTVDGSIASIVAGGGGGGGAGYCGANGQGGQPYVANGTSTTGGNGTNGGGESGGGGGGGGGSFAGQGGAQAFGGSGSSCSGRYYGLGGKRGNSTSTFGTLSTHTGSVAGQFDAYYAPTPVATITLNAETQPPTLNSWTYTVAFLPDTTGVEAGDFTMLENGTAASGWTIGTPTGGPATFTVVATKTGVTDGTTIALQLDQTKVQNLAFGASGFGTAQSANWTVDAIAPTVTSIDVSPDLVTANKISVVMTFSEPIYFLDLTKITLAGTSTVWTATKPAVASYPINSYTFTVVSSSLIDGSLLITGSPGVVTDAAGNTNTIDGSTSETVNTTTKPAVTGFTPVNARFATATNTWNLTFNRAVYGLTASDITISTNPGGCAIDTVTATSGINYTVGIKSCTAGGNVVLSLTANTIKDKVSIAGPTAAALSEVAVRDILGPTITAITNVVRGNYVEYTYTFSEPIFGFTAADISTYTGTTSTGTWTFTEPTRVGSTNAYTFTATNTSATTGALKLQVATGGVADDVGNVNLVNTAQNFTDSTANLWFRPTFTTGTLATISSQDTALAPSFTLDTKGGNIAGIRVTITNAQSGDTLSATALSGMTVTVTNGSTLLATGTTPTAANWQTFIQSIKIRTTSTVTTTRTIEFHLKPFVGYAFESGHVYEFYTGTAGTTWDAYKVIANAKNIGPNYGYLGIINDSAEQAFLTDTTVLTNSVVTGMKKTVGTTAANVGTEVIKAFDGPETGSTISYSNWYTNQPSTAGDMCIYMYSQVSGTSLKGKWDDGGCTTPGFNYALIEYGGAVSGSSFVSSQTVNAAVDIAVPGISSVSGAPTTTTSNLGSTANPLVLTVNFDKAFRNLATGDFTITGAGNTGCVVSAVGSATDTTSPYQSTVTVTGCTVSGAFTLTMAANSINDMTGTTGNAGPATAITMATFTRDITAPTITAITKTVTGNNVAYIYTFSEPIFGLGSANLTPAHSVAGGATGWTFSDPVKSGNTYSFTASNPNAMTGNLTLALANANIKDEAGNALTTSTLTVTSVDQSLATLSILQTFSLGTLNPASLVTPTALAPQITVDGHGGTIAGFRITNKDYVSGDTFALPAGSYGDITVVSNTAGVMTLSGTTATVAQWNAALRAITLQLGANGGSSRSFDFHMQPSKNYWLENGHFYEFVNSGSGKTWVQADALASARTLFGAAGYLAVPFTQTETTFLQGLTSIITAESWIGLQKTASGVTSVKVAATGAPNVGTTVQDFFWNGGEPSVAGDLCLHAYVTTLRWNDISCSVVYSANYLVEYGGTGVAVPALVQTASIEVDNTKPTLLSFAAPAVTSKNPVVYTLTFSEAVTDLVAGDFSFAGSTATGCVATPSASSGTVITVSVTCSGDGNIVLGLNTNSVKDTVGNVGPATLPIYPDPVILDSVVPTITSITPNSLADASTQRFLVTFSEPIVDFTAADINVTGSSGSVGNWTILSPVLVSGNTYRISMTNANFIAGDLSVNIKAAGVTDAAGNANTISAVATKALTPQPTLNVGALTPSNGTGGPIAEALTLTDRGTGIQGALVEVVGAQAGDVLSFTNTDATLFGTIAATYTNGVLSLTYTSPQPTAAQWQAALRQVRFTTNSAGTTARDIAFSVDAFGATNPDNLAPVVQTASLAFDGAAPTLTLTAPAADQTGPAIHFTLTGNENIICSTIATSDFNLSGLSNVMVSQVSPKVCDISATATAAQGTTGPVTISASNTFGVEDIAHNSATSFVTDPAGGSLTVNVTMLDTTPPVLVSFTAESPTATSRTLTYLLTADEALNCASLTAADFTMTGARFVGAISDPDHANICRVIAVSIVPPGAAADSTVALSGAFAFADTAGNSTVPGPMAATSATTSVNIPVSSGSGSIIANLLPGTIPAKIVAHAPAPMANIPTSSQDAMKNAKILAPVVGAPTAVVESDISYLSAADPVALQKATTVEAGSQVKFQIKVAPEMTSGYDVVGYLGVGANWVYIGRQDFAADMMVTTPVTFAEVGTYVMKYFVVPKSATVQTSTIRAKSLTKVIIKKLSRAVITSNDLLAISDKSLEVTVNVITGSIVPVIEQPVVAPPAAPAPAPVPVVTPSASATPTATPTPTPTPTASKSPTPTPSPSASKSASATPTPSPSASATKSAAPTPSASGSATPSASAAPTTPPSPSAAPSPSSTTIAAAPVVTAVPAPAAIVSQLATIAIPQIDPGAPVANPAIGATGDDSAPPTAFDPLASPEGVVAVTNTATQAVAIVSSVAAAAGAAAAAAGAAAAGAAAGAAGAGAAAGGASAGGASGSAGSGSSSSSSGSSNSTSSSGDITELEVSQDHLTLESENWGDRLAMFNLAWLTFFDRRSHNWSERIAKFSPLFAKLINDGAYLRAIFGTLSLVGPIAAVTLAVISVNANAGTILTPPWQLLLVIAVLGLFDAFSGFAAAMVFIVGSVIAAGHFPEISEARLLMGLIVVAIGPALLSTAFRAIRKAAAFNISEWWERITDLVVVPFMAGWSTSAMISTLPALAGLTLPVANHVNDFALAVAAAAFLRVLIEEFAARYYPARLNRINPDEIPDPPFVQKVIALAIKFAIWVFISTALMGPSWQIWVGSALFLLPAVLGWFSDRFPNSPALWRILPTGLPGLALSLVVATLTTSLVGAWLGATPELAQWSFVILPMPLLAISALGLFGRHGSTPDEEKPAKKSVWVYRIGGVIMLVVTLKLAGVI